MMQWDMELLCYVRFMTAPVLLKCRDKDEYYCLCSGLRCDPVALFEQSGGIKLLFHRSSWEVSAEKEL